MHSYTIMYTLEVQVNDKFNGSVYLVRIYFINNSRRLFFEWSMVFDLQDMCVNIYIYYNMYIYVYPIHEQGCSTNSVCLLAYEGDSLFIQ